MSRTCANLFEQILSADIYGTRPQLKIGKLQTFKTKFGTILTFLSIFTMLSTVIYSSLQLFDNTRPKVMLSVRNIFNPPLYELSKENYGFAFGLQDPSTYDQYIDETVYRVEVYQKNAVRTNHSGFEWHSTKLEVERCSISKFPVAFKKVFESTPLNNMYCLKETEFSLFGTFLNDQYSFLYIQLFECRNNTLHNQQPCKPKEYIDSMLAGAFFSFPHTDITVDPTNYTNPNQNYAGDSYTTVSNRYFKEMHHYVKQVSIETDRGWLTTDIHKQIFLKDDYVKEMIDFREFENFLSYTLKLSTVIETYSRSYSKVQNVAAEVGGCFKLISIVCLVLTYFYNKTKFYELLTNELFDFSPDNFESKMDKNGVNSSKVMLNPNNSEYRSNIRKDETNSKSMMMNNYLNKKEESQAIPRRVASGVNLFLMKIKDNTNALPEPEITKTDNINTKYINDDEKKLKDCLTMKDIPNNRKVKSLSISLSFLQSSLYLVCPCFFRKQKKLEIFDKAGPLIDERLDILTLFKKIQDIDRIKSAIFDQDQLKIFNLPYKTKLIIGNDKKKKSLNKSNNDANDLSNEDINKAFDNIKTKIPDNKISENIFAVISDDYQQVFQ